MSLLAAKKLRLTKKCSTGMLLTKSDSSSSLSLSTSFSKSVTDYSTHFGKSDLNLWNLFFGTVPYLSSSLIRSIAFSLKSVLG